LSLNDWYIDVLFNWCRTVNWTKSFVALSWKVPPSCVRYVKSCVCGTKLYTAVSYCVHLRLVMDIFLCSNWVLKTLQRYICSVITSKTTFTSKWSVACVYSSTY
jgi:hypothetical protein